MNIVSRCIDVRMLFMDIVNFNWELNFWCSLLNLAEIADGPIAFASQKDKIQLSVSNTKSNGSRSGRPPRKSSASRRSKDDESEKSQSFDSKLPMSPKQEEIISLFRRIQSSISKGENQRTKSTKPSNPNSSPTESILEILHQSKKPIKGNLDRLCFFQLQIIS